MKTPKKTQHAGHEFLNPWDILKRVGVSYGMAVADFGCGAGYFVLDAARIVGDDGVVYGVDVLKHALSALESKARMYGMSNIKTVWANVEVYRAIRRIPAGSVDVVLLVQLLSQTTKHGDVFREALRILDRHGRIAVVDWKPGGGKFSHKQEHCVPSATVVQTARAAGLQLVHESEASPYHYALVFERA
ncbi:MAG: methyltransferase domain-containing protein [Patescibacteria group bacterium]|nr:methyltransferase domain-containing protein [Patescibacteria group bacterium]MDD5715583.1 methyltransferase domain-containing protein [Patescibacteria group bacterium]